MRRRDMVGLLAAPAVISLSSLGRSQTKQKVTYIYQLDPIYETALWAIRNGKVASSFVAVEATAANIPTLLQATATKHYDVVMTATTGVPAAARRGLNLRILSAALCTAEPGEGGGIWVNKGSSIKSPVDLKGKTLASAGLRSTGYMLIREALAARYGLDVSLEGGDFKQVEVVAANMPAALATGHVDAATLQNSQEYLAQQSGEFVNICQTGRIMNEIYGRLVNAVNVSYPERLAERPEAFIEFDLMLKASVDYAKQNRDEVFGAVAKQSGIAKGFFDWRYDRSTDIPYYIDDAMVRSIETVWKIGLKYGITSSTPDVNSVLWEHAIRV